MWLWIAATLAAFFVKGLCGFANTLVFTSVMGFGADNINISPVELVLGYPSNVILTWRNRKKLNPRVFVPLSVLVLAGSIPGAFLLKQVNARYVKIAFGVVVILMGIEMLTREYAKRQIKNTKAGMVIIGFLAGILCGLFGVGALLAAYVSRASESTDEFKANISAVFIVENTFRLILYSSVGIITAASLKQSLILMPFMLAGLAAGIKCGEIIDEKIAKKLVIVLLIISGAALILMNL